MLQAACQTYTWEMLGDAFSGGPDDLLDAIAGAGYLGIEITDRMIGRYADDAPAFAAALAARGLTLVAFACGSASGFTEPDEFEADLTIAGAAIDFLAGFPGAILSLGSATVVSEGPAEAKFAAAARLYNAAGALGRARGVTVAFHPSSHAGTLLASRADYDRIMALTDPDLVGWVPDTGHILRGGQDLLATLAAHAERIRALHLKDVGADGDWRMLGSGICDVAAVAEAVQAAPHFNGWLIVEEESDEAAVDPAAAVARNRATLRRLVPQAA